MNKVFFAAGLSALLVNSIAAHGADMAVKARPKPPPAPVALPAAFTWTGFYIGGNLGGAWAHEKLTDSRFGLNFGNINNNGMFMGGGQAGFNYQIGNIVVGVEGDFDALAKNNNTSNGVLVPPLGMMVRGASNDRWLASAAARLGWTVDRLLFYGKGGGGWVNDSGIMLTDVTTGASTTASNNKTTGGFLAGAGVEWAFANNLTAKVEYDYLGLSSQTFTLPATSTFLAGDTFTTGTRNVQTVKVGLNYLFNWGGMRY